MGKNLHFAYTGPEPCAKVVRVIPSSWSEFSGKLSIPEYLRGQVVIKGPDKEIYSPPKFSVSTPTCEIIAGRVEYSDSHSRAGHGSGLPSFVSFHEAGRGGSSRFCIFRDVAAKYVELGYQGWLKFVKKGRTEDGSSEYEQAWCEIHINPSDDEPSEIVLAWRARYGGRVSDLGGILSACYFLNLPRLGLSLASYT